MKKLLLILVFLIIAGCSAKEETIEKDKPAKELEKVATEESPRSDESLNDLLAEVNFEEQLVEACGNLTVEMTSAYLEVGSSRPAIVGFCHNNGDVSLEQEQAYIGIAIYDETNEQWNIDLLEHEFMYQPSRYAGNLQLEDGSERVVIELYEDPAAFGSTSAIVVSSTKSKVQIERINSTVTQVGEFRTEGNKVIIEDDFTIETYTYNQNNVSHTTSVKEMATEANLVITYNKHEDGKLFASLESGKVLNVQPGDIISFKPEKPLSLVDFQIRTSLNNNPDMPDSFVVSESDMGETIELGEYPYDDMIVYYVGDPKWFASKEYLNQLNKGYMPGSKVQLTTPNTEIKTILEDEYLINEYGQSGANHLEYEQYIYAIPFLEEEGDKIYSVIRKIPFGIVLTGDDFIKGWGEPTDMMTDMDSLEESIILHYGLDNGHYVFVYLRGNTTDTQATSIHLF